MNELILKITNIAIAYPNQLNKFYAVSKVSDKIDWKLFTTTISEYLELNCHSSSPMITVFERVLNAVNEYFCRIIVVWDYDGNSVRKIEEFSRKENIEVQLVVEQKEEPPIKRFFSWIKNIFAEKSENVINEVIEVKENANGLSGKAMSLIPYI